jgi:uncharacterized protein YecE (DUF72 family)
MATEAAGQGACFVGTAGWSIASAFADVFPAEGSALERYAAHFPCAEINSSFHRSHRASTYARWEAAVPQGFRFSAKLPKTITHQQKLVDCCDLLDAFVAEIAPLGAKLALILVQLPPSLAFDEGVADTFFAALRSRFAIALACEPRHASWFEPAADALLGKHQIARVAADPALIEAAARSGGWRGLSYYRLHGSPRIYRSSYDEQALAKYAEMLATDRQSGREAWCIFDNTASSAATGNALRLKELLV